MAFIQKNWQKNVQDNITKAVCRIGGGLGSAFLLKKFFSKTTTNSEKTLHNIGGPAMMLTGMAVDLVADNQYIKSIAQGITVFSAAHSLAVISPSAAESFGLSGIAAPEATPENAALMGAAGTCGALPSGLPEEFNEIDPNQIQNDNNPWGQVADEIDNPNVQVKVEGVEPEAENAELMAAEEAELMGMY